MLRLSAITLAFVLHRSTFSLVLTDLFSNSSSRDGSFLTVLITAVVSGLNLLGFDHSCQRANIFSLILTLIH